MSYSAVANCYRAKHTIDSASIIPFCRIVRYKAISDCYITSKASYPASGLSGVLDYIAAKNCRIAVSKEDSTTTYLFRRIVHYSTADNSWAALPTEDSTTIFFRPITCNCAVLDCQIAVPAVYSTTGCSSRISGYNTVHDCWACISTMDSSSFPMYITIGYCQTIQYRIYVFIIVEVKSSMRINFSAVAVDDRSSYYAGIVRIDRADSDSFTIRIDIPVTITGISARL